MLRVPLHVLGAARILYGMKGWRPSYREEITMFLIHNSDHDRKQLWVAVENIVAICTLADRENEDS